MNVLAIIPARGGSKGIPRKNLRLMNGRPLIEYAIKNALNCSAITHVVVTSDSEEILGFAQQFESIIGLNRSSALAQDAITLDPVVYDALLRAENQMGCHFDVVVTLQPTSPLLTTDTLARALQDFVNSDATSYISVVNKPHLAWVQNEAGFAIPAYGARKNRQELPPYFLETGAFVISRRACVTEESRLGDKVHVFEVPEQEAIDIDAMQDWIICEAQLARKVIAFRVDGYEQIGMGHIFRALTLAYELVGHDVVFICDAAYREGIQIIQAANFPVVEISGEQALFKWLQQEKPDIFVNDTLDTTEDYIVEIKKRVSRVITFEDCGKGAYFADAVVNAIYEDASKRPSFFTGEDYVCLRDEFQIALPSPFRKDAKKILVAFGGSDPLDLSSRLFALAAGQKEFLDYRFDIVLGPAYNGKLLPGIYEDRITVVRDAVRMSDYMRNADVACSSQGRTTFELASMGVPALVLAQNERETLHSFASDENGFINLGLGSEVSDKQITETLSSMLTSQSLRIHMRERMLAHDLKSGIRRVKRIILGEI